MSFEHGFADVERAALGALKALASLHAAVRQVEKAAREGDLGAIERASGRFETALAAVRQEVANTKAAWPYSPEQTEEYLNVTYAAELLAAGASIGLSIHDRDGRLVAFPSVVRIIPAERALRVDRTRSTKLRPSVVAAGLKANQAKRPRFPSERFLEAILRAYQLLVGPDLGRTVLLKDVLSAFTLRPGSQAEYDQTDFARDLYALDQSGARVTKQGFRMSLPAATGTKGQQGVLSFVGPDGIQVTYYGLRFEAPK